MLFEDRLDAALKLAHALAAYGGSNPLVLAIPRGAVPMGAALADSLRGELDVVLVHKLGSPWSAEYALGSVDESGWVFVSDPASADPAYLKSERARRLEELRKRRQLYSPSRKAADPKGRITIVVDDGLATGATMIAALHAIRQRAPGKLICAVPVGAPQSLKRVRPYADEVVCLHAPPYFSAVGEFYRHFSQVSDEEVIVCLEAHHTQA